MPRRAPKSSPALKADGEMRSISLLEDSARASLLISCLIQAVRCGKYEVNCSCHRKEEQFLGEAVFYLTRTPTSDPPHVITGRRTSAAYSAVRLSYRYGGVLKKSCRQDNLYGQEEFQNYSS